MALGPTPKDLTGQRFGKLVALEYVGASKWRCQCDCGNICYPKGYSLRAGITASCGCVGKENLKLGHRKRANLVGKTFEYLTVLEYIPESKKYRCLCRCGNEPFVGATHLTTGRVKSCGCRPKDVPCPISVGQRFSKLVVVKEVGRNSHKQRVWECLCDCGNTAYATTGILRRGKKRSCGCLYDERGEKISKTKRTKHNPPLEENRWSYELESVLRKCLTSCAICGMSEEDHIEKCGERLHVDHLRPYSLGHKLSLDNVVLLCRSCNAKKGNKDLRELPKSQQEKLLMASNKFVLYYESLM